MIRRFVGWIALALVMMTSSFGVQAKAEEPQTGAPPVKPGSVALMPENARDATLKSLADGSYEVTATSATPTFDLAFEGTIDPARTHVVAFSYFSTHSTHHVRMEYGAAQDKVQVFEGAGLSHSEGFSSYSTDLGTAPNWQGEIKILRMGFETLPGTVIQLRNLQLREPTAAEAQMASRKAQAHIEDGALAVSLRQYLTQSFPAMITSIYVSKNTIHIEGEAENATAPLYLVEVAPYQNVTELQTFDYRTLLRLNGGKFATDLVRYRTLPDHLYDRVLSKWAVALKVDGKYVLQSHVHYADEVASQWNLPDEVPQTKKGLGGFHVDGPASDIEDLGITSVTVNIHLDFLKTAQDQGTIPFSYCGKQYYADEAAIASYDATMRYAAAHKLVVSAILLASQVGNLSQNDPNRVLAYPDADPAGIYAMPNLATEEGLQTYAAVLNFLAERYSRPDKLYGRIHHWIMHNEVDAGWVWTNAGDKSELTFMDLYIKSMRVMYLIARQYNPHSKVFISLTHFWNWTEDPHFYLPHHMLDDLLAYSKAEGDFEWAIAYHPYPESLFHPRTWEDTKVNFTFDTPLITFKNIEVLDAWVNRPEVNYRGIKRRTVYLSEQGFDSPDYTQKSLTEQAAGLAYAWKKIEHLDSIEAVQYHNWIDSRGEGGLRIGLRKFRDEPGDPLGKKPIWQLYQKLNTPEEDQACEFAKAVIGIPNWNQVRYTKPIDPSAGGSRLRNLQSDTWVATDALGRKLPSYAETGPPRPGRYVGMFYFLTFRDPGKPGPKNVTEQLAKDSNTAAWKPGTYYWGKPESGYYLSTDEWVIRRHAEMLADAGVDVIIFDSTNDDSHPPEYRKIAETYEKMRAAGEPTPQIAFLASAKSIIQVWNDLYGPGLYKDLWFQWKGKPLLLIGQQRGMPHIYQLPQEIQRFFSIRESWAWDSLPWYTDGRDQWPWVEHTPQRFGWHESPERPEAVGVAVAEHPLSAIGRSFYNRVEPPTNAQDITPDTPRGLYFQEQWDRAIQLDPEFVFVTGWNEWTAGSMRMGKNISADLQGWDFYPGALLGRAGHPIHTGDLYFIDQYNEEFSRDIEPMEGGHTDNYYYQLVANVRRYKGQHAPEPASLEQTIDLKGSFVQWDAVTPEYCDHVDDTIHRNEPGNFQAGPYVDDTGRNDIVAAKVARDKNYVYFYARTQNPLTPPAGHDWMQLYIDADQNTGTGWEGYDYRIDGLTATANRTMIQKYAGNGQWGKPVPLDMRVEGNQIMIAVPRTALGITGDTITFDFHWMDNAQVDNNNEYFLHGDNAPERRFNYRFEATDSRPD